ncbi:hypothetical protein AMAG_13485 [Allomyces macrogynus ATCC 38327]|uniref:Uncharacterized protein n=1 Tax=Allomyces macrogynus (strain ATCC 38327) TaxID=578462 RepID=A0A0L0T2G2_ALLM3|nr:hypothetical protein AMAG_13485 [Allomyces macrogynus ATCC 38327]|eukprot:KNE68845.1 hypothetical protein AMAG_13485 [Allomyces macrogynus ATCC 38327]
MASTVSALVADYLAPTVDAAIQIAEDLAGPEYAVPVLVAAAVTVLVGAGTALLSHRSATAPAVPASPPLSPEAKRLKYLKKLLKSARQRIDDLDHQAGDVARVALPPVMADADAIRDDDEATAAATDKVVKQLQYLDEKGHKLLEALDNVKTHGILLEYTDKYPLPEEAEAEDDDEEDVLPPQDRLLRRITAEFEDVDRERIAAQFEALKANRKALVTALLATLARLEEMISSLIKVYRQRKEAEEQARAAAAPPASASNRDDSAPSAPAEEDDVQG